MMSVPVNAEMMNIRIDANDHLEFQISQPFSALFRFKPWEEGFTFEIFEDGDWHVELSDCGLPLLGLLHTEHNTPCVLRFLSRIPADIRHRVQHYTFAQANLLRWLAINGYARELFESAPLLCWMLIARQQQQGWPESHVEKLLKSSRTQVLSAISGIGQKSALKWLAKIQLDRASSHECSLLVDALRMNFHRSLCAAQPKIQMHWIRYATRYEALSSSRAFSKYCVDNPQETSDFRHVVSQHARFWDDAIAVARVLGIEDAHIALQRCVDLDSVRRLHDRWTDRMNQRQALVVHGATPFPETPIPGNETIHPITSLEDLQAEGRLMHHCVSVYEPAIRKGECYIYRILKPERATIEVSLTGNQARARQVKLAYNGRTSNETRLEIESWLVEASKPAGSR